MPKNPKILHVEDEPSRNEGLVDCLRKEGYEVLKAANILDAFQSLVYFKNERDKFDLIIQDIYMDPMLLERHEACRDLPLYGGFCLLLELERKRINIKKLVYANRVYIEPQPRVKNYLEREHIPYVFKGSGTDGDSVGDVINIIKQLFPDVGHAK